jgi:uncharacterized protein with NAD-binding domain and iron-sulfur cluster
MATQRRKKIVILGGGLGSLSAAYWLTEKDGWQDEYEITLYQRGWRLGGKGASGRSVTPRHGQRIEEHGPHIWYGFYENAFKTLRRTYEQLAESGSDIRTFRSWKEAFARRSLWTVQDEVMGQPVHWPVLFPTNSAEPGTQDAPFSWAIVENVIGWLVTGRHILLGTQSSRLRQVMSATRRMARTAGATVKFAAGRTLTRLNALVGGAAPQRRLIADFIRQIADELIDDVITAGGQESQRVAALIDLVATSAVGIVQDDLLRHGFESVDEEELCDWLRRHGARDTTVASHLLSQVYDLIFGYLHGDPKRPNLAAGTGVRGLIRFALTYKGAFMYEMHAGMGDTIFTPLYALLRARGVKFEFFHRVKAIRLDPADLSRIGSIELGRQVRVTAGEYHPLLRVKGIDCWPNEPDYAQLVEGKALRAFVAEHPDALESSWSTWSDTDSITLRYGKDPQADFDDVVLGIPVAALPAICGELIDNSPRWRNMVEGVQTTRTYAIQLWLNATTEDLGWSPPQWMRDLDAASDPPLGLQSILCGYTSGLNAWGDFSHLIRRENWSPADGEPRSISYFCGALPDPPDGRNPYGAEAADEAKASMRRSAVAALDAQIGRLWPRAGTPQHPDGLDPKLLFNPTGAANPLDAQYWRVNVDPSERYTLSVAGSTKRRIPGSVSGFRHLYLAGDWTRNGVINVGCVEGAVASGMEVSRALCGVPQRIVGEDRRTVAADRWNAELLKQLRSKGDSFADAAIQARFAGSQNGAVKDLVRELARRHEDDDAGLPPELHPLRDELHPHGDGIPLDPARIQRGEELFADHGPEIMLVLACYSLPAAYAANNGARVLGRTDYLMKDPRRRLLETAQMVVDVMTPADYGPGGRGLRTAKKVRLMHAAIRELILAGSGNGNGTPARWDSHEFGRPINQEDLLGTLMTFSWVVLDGLQRMGTRLTAEQRDAYLEAWRSVGLGLGIKYEHMPVGFEEATALTRTIQERQIQTHIENKVGKCLTASLIDMMRKNTPLRVLRPLGGSLMRLFLPPAVADSLGVPRNRIYDGIVRHGVRLVPLVNWTLRSVTGERHAFRRFSLTFLQAMIAAQSDGERPRFAIPQNLENEWWKGQRERHVPPPALH